MPAMSRRAVGIVEVKIGRHRFVDGVLQVLRSGSFFELNLYGAQRCGSDREEKRALFRTTRADQQNLGPAKLREGKAPESISFFQRRDGKKNGTQEFSGTKNVAVIAGDKIYNGHRAGLAFARPKRADSLQRGSQRDHRACRKRHDDISADGSLVPDFE